MGRLIIVVFMLIISGIIYLVKAGAGKITGKDVNFQDESKKVMAKTARGINWMNEQWESAKASSGVTKLSLGNNTEMSAIEFIAQVKANPTKYDNATAESLYIEQAVTRLNNRQFDDARKLVMQLEEGDARTFMLEEIEQKRNA